MFAVIRTPFFVLNVKYYTKRIPLECRRSIQSKPFDMLTLNHINFIAIGCFPRISTQPSKTNILLIRIWKVELAFMKNIRVIIFVFRNSSLRFTKNSFFFRQNFQCKLQFCPSQRSVTFSVLSSHCFVRIFDYFNILIYLCVYVYMFL